MKKLLAIILAALVIQCVYEYSRPVEQVNVVAYLEQGKTIWQAVDAAAKSTGDVRPINELVYETVKYNRITPEEVGKLPVGQKIIIPCKVRVSE